MYLYNTLITKQGRNSKINDMPDKTSKWLFKNL